MRDLVYVCSPLKAYGSETQESNISKAVRNSRFVYEQGYTPIAPHIIFTQFMDDSNEKERTDAIIMGQQILRNCAQLWVFGDYISEGMRNEIALAQQWGIPINYIKNISGKGAIAMKNSNTQTETPDNERVKLLHEMARCILQTIYDCPKNERNDKILQLAKIYGVRIKV